LAFASLCDQLKASDGKTEPASSCAEKIAELSLAVADLRSSLGIGVDPFFPLLPDKYNIVRSKDFRVPGAFRGASVVNFFREYFPDSKEVIHIGSGGTADIFLVRYGPKTNLKSVTLKMYFDPRTGQLKKNGHAGSKVEALRFKWLRDLIDARGATLFRVADAKSTRDNRGLILSYHPGRTLHDIIFDEGLDVRLRQFLFDQYSAQMDLVCRKTDSMKFIEAKIPSLNVDRIPYYKDAYAMFLILPRQIVVDSSSLDMTIFDPR